MKAQKIAKVLDKALIAHHVDVARSEMKLSGNYHYQGRCACGYMTDVSTNLTGIMQDIQKHVRDEVTMRVYRAVRKQPRLAVL